MNNSGKYMNFVKGGKSPGGILSFEAIETQRQALGKSVEELCGKAGISPRGYYNCRKGLTSARRLTRSRLTRALAFLANEELQP